jgi:hypothetical protein
MSALSARQASFVGFLITNFGSSGTIWIDWPTDFHCGRGGAMKKSSWAYEVNFAGPMKNTSTE